MNEVKLLKKVAKSRLPEGPRAAQLLAEIKGLKAVAGFFGSFSSGKSTIIGALTGKNILPSGALPTTSHMVYLSNGKPGLTAVYKDGLKRHTRLSKKMLAAGDLKELSSFLGRKLGCIYEKDAVSEFRLEYGIPFLGKHFMIMDTPGINSVSSGHGGIAAEAAGITDIMVYVINMQQPLSESDTVFLKEYGRKCRRLILLLNKSDVVDESEQSVNEITLITSEAIKKETGIDSFFIYPVSARNILKNTDDPAVNAFTDFRKKLFFIIREAGEEILEEKKRDLILKEFPAIEALARKADERVNKENSMAAPGVSKGKRFKLSFTLPGKLKVSPARAMALIITLALVFFAGRGAWSLYGGMASGQPEFRWMVLGTSGPGFLLERIGFKGLYEDEILCLERGVPGDRLFNPVLSPVDIKTGHHALRGNVTDVMDDVSVSLRQGKSSAATMFNHFMYNDTISYKHDEIKQNIILIMLATAVLIFILYHAVKIFTVFPQFVSNVIILTAFAIAAVLVILYILPGKAVLLPDSIARFAVYDTLVLITGFAVRPRSDPGQEG